MKKLLIILLLCPFLAHSQNGGIWTFANQRPVGASIFISPTAFPQTFTNTAGSPSGSQQINYSYNSIPANSGGVTLPSWMEGSLDNSTWNAGPFTSLQGSGIFYSRVKAATSAGTYGPSYVIFTATGAKSDSCLANATVTSGTHPTNVSSPPTLSFSTPVNTQSTNLIFTLNGNNLTGNDTVNAPAGFGVGTDGFNYTTQIILTQGGGTITQQIYTVLLSNTTPGSLSGYVITKSAGATPDSVAVSGTVTSSTGGDVSIGQFFMTLTAATPVTNFKNVIGGPDTATITNFDLANEAANNGVPVSLKFYSGTNRWNPLSGQHAAANAPQGATAVNAPASTYFSVATCGGYVYNQIQNYTGFALADTSAIVGGLTPGQLYTMIMMPSRAVTNRTMTFYIIDSTNNRVDSDATIDAGQNATHFYVMQNIVPDSRGTFKWAVTPRAGDGTSVAQYGFANAFVIIWQGSRKTGAMDQSVFYNYKRLDEYMYALNHPYHEPFYRSQPLEQ